MSSNTLTTQEVTTYLGHSSITITLDMYGHLMPGNEDEAAALLDAYLVRADTSTTLARLAVAIGSDREG